MGHVCLIRDYMGGGYSVCSLPSLPLRGGGSTMSATGRSLTLRLIVAAVSIPITLAGAAATCPSAQITNLHAWLKRQAPKSERFRGAIR
jgi:hypothetical protein